jgi:hypothetical protein
MGRYGEIWRDMRRYAHRLADGARQGWAKPVLYISPHLPISPHISAYLRISPHRLGDGAR